MMSKICFKCSQKPSKGIDKPFVQTVKCSDCKHAFSVRYCDICKAKQMYCRIARYYHDADTLKKCVMFRGK